jgi:hypothetical protein
VRPALLLAATALGTAACGGTSTVSPAPPTTRELNWRDDAGPSGSRVVLTVRSLTIDGRGWHVRASVTNDTRRTLGVARIHNVSRARFGLAVVPRDERAAPPELVATRFEPKLPSALAPGETWAGEFGARGDVPRGAELRVVVGTFFAIPPIVLDGRRFARFNVYSDESVRL